MTYPEEKQLFDKTYFESKNYENYLNRDFSHEASDITFNLGLNDRSVVVDFGCGPGGMLEALNRIGVGSRGRLVGSDVSNWAIDYGKTHFRVELHYYNREVLAIRPDLLILLDVIEHMTEAELESFFYIIEKYKPKAILVRIPVSAKEGEDYYYKASLRDDTHKPAHAKEWWTNKFNAAGFSKIQFISWSTIYDTVGVLSCIFRQT